MIPFSLATQMTCLQLCMPTSTINLEGQTLYSIGKEIRQLLYVLISCGLAHTVSWRCYFQSTGSNLV